MRNSTEIVLENVGKVVGKVVNATSSKIFATSSTPEFPLGVLYIAVTIAGLFLLHGLIQWEILREDGERATFLRVAMRMFLVNFWLWVLTYVPLVFP
jgi:hypothetical protein